MDNKEFTRWLLAVSTQVNRALKVMPAMVWERNASLLLAQDGIEKLGQLATTLGIVDMEKMQLIVEQYADLGNQLANEDAQQTLRSFVSTSKFAPRLKTLRLMAAWLASPGEETSDSQVEWRIEDTPNNGRIYRTILRGEQDEKDICNNQSKC